LSGVISLVGAAVYLLFGSVELQSWAKRKEEEEEDKALDAKPMLKIKENIQKTEKI